MDSKIFIAIMEINTGGWDKRMGNPPAFYGLVALMHRPSACNGQATNPPVV